MFFNCTVLVAGSSGAGFGIENPSLSFIQQIQLNTFSRILVIGLCTMLVASMSTHYKVQYHQQWL